ncbi:macrocin O-methyltransferase [Thiohalocapsa marina]|uniref:Macrocin O-methyltransferase n=1 Tax=Thiohalocapsa marina TaxID=424902 RepID=A0A5M8FUC9_9GAMM|nr:TylF/MycF family methyltransferase [Thiohalocapsa marina]KAA6187407.1 macrocin O-methyltransferase [Thiohalocapsa marina]
MTPSALYLDLLKNCLTGLLYEDIPSVAFPFGYGMPSDKSPETFVRVFRETGRDVPGRAQTMVGLRRLNNVQQCIETVLTEKIPGDLIETGVWRGGVTILMRGILKAHGVVDRVVWVADSFQGLPVPDLDLYPSDAMLSKEAGHLAVSKDQVRQNFQRYGLLDEQVQFLPGWFKDTLPTAPIERLAVLRLDGDLYESTKDALVNLYPKLSPGGFVIIDDYNIRSCREAVDDYRLAQGIEEPIEDIDGWGVFWRRSE